MTMSVCFISICIIFVQELQLSYGQYECPVNEVPVECVDACNTCESTGQPCALICIPGCDCTLGYARDRFGVCIPRTYCNEDSLSVPDADDIRVCPDSGRCANICRRRGFVVGTCKGLVGRTCHCFNRRHPEISDGPPLSLDNDDDDDDDGDGDSGIESRRGRRCKKFCIGKKKMKSGKCTCKGRRILKKFLKWYLKSLFG